MNDMPRFRARLRTRKQTAHGRPLYPPATWIWQGFAAHFISAARCRYHLATVVGPWIVSTVGAYLLPEHEREGGPFTEVGSGRFYETMVFRAERCRIDPDICIEHHAVDGKALATLGANTLADAYENHMQLCALFARRGPRWRKR